MHEVQLFTNVEFDTIIVGSLCVEIGIYEVGATCHSIRPLDRVAEVLIEE